jgi:transcriptional antiterminator NusG
MDEAKWYVAHTYSGYENKVANSLEAVVDNRNIRDLIQEVKVPTEITEEIKDGKKKEVERKLYPSYVFVKMVLTDETWYIVRNTRGVTGFVGASSQKPSPLSEKEVENLGIEVRKQTVDFAVGDHVEITDGPLAGFVGVVEKIDAKNMKVMAKVSMFGRETETELDLLQVKPI